jgi:methionyl-tRNA synthetase
VGEALVERARALDRQVDEALARFAPDDALRAIWAVVAAGNKHLASTAPWTLAKDPAQGPLVRAILEHAALALGAVGRALVPFLPATARAITAALADPHLPAPILFPKSAL